MDAVGADEHVGAHGMRLLRGAVGHADRDALVVGHDAREAVAGEDRIGPEALAHGVRDDALEHPAVDRELRDVVPRVEAARLVPDLLALAVEVEELRGPQRDGVERVEEAQVAQRADRVRQRVDPDAELAELARRLEHGDVAHPALVEREGRREAADAAADDEDAHVPDGNTVAPCSALQPADEQTMVRRANPGELRSTHV